MKLKTHTTEIPVKFSEVDSLRIVWHGHYVRYCEDAREAFGLQNGLHYLQIFENGYLTPIVAFEIEYKKPLKYGETAVVHTEFIPTDAAKIIFNYIIYEKNSGEVIAKASSIQVFLQADNFALILTNPDFFQDWKTQFLSQ